MDEMGQAHRAGLRSRRRPAGGGPTGRASSASSCTHPDSAGACLTSVRATGRARPPRHNRRRITDRPGPSHGARPRPGRLSRPSGDRGCAARAAEQRPPGAAASTAAFMPSMA